MTDSARRPKGTPTERRLLDAIEQARRELDGALAALDELENLAAYAQVEAHLLAPDMQAKARHVRTFIVGYTDELRRAKELVVRMDEARGEIGR